MVIERCVFCERVIPKGQRRCRCEEDGKSDNVTAVAALQCFAAATSPRSDLKNRRGAAESRKAGFGAFDAFEGTTNSSTARKGRAKCPRFRDRNDYQGVSRIGCGRDDMQLRFASENERDEHYVKYCCDRCNECRWFGLNPSGASRHLPFTAVAPLPRAGATSLRESFGFQRSAAGTLRSRVSGAFQGRQGILGDAFEGSDE